MESSRRFRNRQDAGRQLAAALGEYAGEDSIVVALPRGGVPVGYEVARSLRVPLDIRVVRKLGVPFQPELGMGAVAEGGFTYVSPEIVTMAGVSERTLADVVTQKRLEVEERVRKFRGGWPRPDLHDRTVILVDDGIATGGTVRVAIRSIRAEMPRRIVLAAPVAAADTIRALSPEVDRVVCLLIPPELYAIGVWYDDFAQVSDEEVASVLARAREEEAGCASPGPTPLDRPAKDVGAAGESTERSR
ncbi:MAG TPA: phosphoribosyltransferase [Polyangiaceae bacterium]|nr:phosphoribosyltransferase [Polyangiaceae bacterium]